MQFETFRASIDYFTFDYKQLIAQSEGPQAIVDNDCDDGVPNDPRVIRDAGGQLRQVDTEFVNIGAVETDGIDFKADYTVDIGNSSLIFDFAATYVLSFNVDTDGDGTLEFDGAGSRNARNNFSTMPEWRGLLGGTWLAGNHSVNLTARYIDSYENDQSRSDAAHGLVGGPVDSWTTLDAQYSIVLPELLGGGDTVFTLGVRNIMDEDPPALHGREDDGTVTTRFNADGTYNRSWVDRPGYDDRAGVDLRGRILYFRFKQTF
jgi:iron complex outermembrane receptor protein